MSSEEYLMTDEQLVIKDPELNIDLKSFFSMPRLPLDYSKELPGVVVEKDNQGKLRSLYLVREGRRHGQCRHFSDEGNLRSETFYLEGKLHGPSIVYGTE